MPKNEEVDVSSSCYARRLRISMYAATVIVDTAASNVSICIVGRPPIGGSSDIVASVAVMLITGSCATLF